MKPTDNPLQKGMRYSRGCAGNNRNDSTHMLTEVKCVGNSRSRRRVSGRRMSGSKAMTIGNNRMPLRLTASAASTSAEPAPSAEIKITCAGAAHTNMDDSASHHDEKPKS